MTRCGWVRPRELERLVSKLTNWFLLHRPWLAVFNAVYAFCHSESPERPRRFWPSVMQELGDAVAVLPLVRSNLSRPVAEQLIQTDACDTGGAVVCTKMVEHAELRQECARPVGRCAHRRRQSRRGVPRLISPQLSPPAWSRKTGTLRCGPRTRQSRARGSRTSTRRKPARSSSRFDGLLGRVGPGVAVSLCRATRRRRCVRYARGVLRGLACGASTGKSQRSRTG